MAASSNSKLAGALRAGFAAAAILALVPAGIIGMQSYRLNAGQELRLPVEIATYAPENLIPGIQIKTPLNTLRHNRIASDSQFVSGETAYVFLSPGPEGIWYPYALTRRKSKQSCKAGQCLMLMGNVENVTDSETQIRYGFEDIVAAGVSKEIISAPSEISEIVLAVSNSGKGALKSYRFDGQSFAQRRFPIPTLAGFRNIGAIAAPPK